MSKSETEIFEAAESSGRGRADIAISKINFGNANYYKVIPTTGGCRWDYEIVDKLSNKVIGIIEAKDRTLTSTDWRIKKEGFQIEHNKYDALLKKAKKDNINAYILVTMADDYYMVWDIVASPITEDVRDCPKCSAVDRGRVMKRCVYFKVKDTFAKGKL